MAGYLERYGTGEIRREKIVKRLLASVLIIAVVGGALWWRFRDYREEQKVNQFFTVLKQKDYKAAYALWGCTDQTPCRHYPFDKFLEDWGPQSPHANAEAAKLAQRKSCRAGLIQFVEFPGQEPVTLWVERSTQTLGFSPFPVCNPRMQVP